MRGSLALALAIASCGGSTTEIVLAIDTDVEGADGLRVIALGPDGDRSEASADLSVAGPPRTLVLVHRGGELGPVRLTVEALVRGTAAVTVVREVTFERGRSRRLLVFLAGSCRERACPAPETCGNGGECRSALVSSCEYDASCVADAGGDAGPLAPDAGGTLDGGGCPLAGSICGVGARHLPGDRVAPIPCDPPTVAVSSSLFGPGGLVVEGVVEGPGAPRAYVLGRSGSYEVQIERAGDPSCAIRRAIEVAAPVLVPDRVPVSADELRDLDARVGTAFVAGRRGAYAVDASGWFALRPVSTGAALPEDLRAVVVHAGHPVFGPNGDLDGVYRLIAEAPFDAAAVSAARVVLPGGSREIRALDVRLDRAGPLLAATKDGAVVIEAIDGAPSAMQVGASYDPGTAGWAALGALEAGHGAIWLGRTDELANRADARGPAFNGESAADLPAWLVSACDGAVDDRDPLVARLWVCGSGGVAMWVLSGEWSALSALPPPSASWSGVCRDLAVGDDGHVWVAAGTSIVRLDAAAETRVTYGPDLGLPAGTSADRVAFAANGSHREVWVLDATSSPRAVLSLSADPLP